MAMVGLRQRRRRLAWRAARSTVAFVSSAWPYRLRSNLTGGDPAQLWTFCLQLTEVEQAFKELKHDLAIRPIYHQTDERIEAHNPGGIFGLLPAGYPEAAAAITGTGADAVVCAGQIGGDPNGRRSSADDGRPHRHPVTPHRTRAGSGAAASDAEAQFAWPTATQDRFGWHSDSIMNTPSVVPTLRRHTTENQPFVGLSAVSCESRVSRCRRLAKDWECLNRNALAFLR
jgi:hypothetical protein